MSVGEITLCQKTEGETNRPGRQHDSQSGNDFMLDKPVRYHFGQDDVEDRAPDAGDQATGIQRSHAVSGCHYQCTDDHRQRTYHQEVLIRDGAGQSAARYGDEDTRQQKETNQGAYLRIAQAEIGNEMSGYRGD